MEKGSIVEFEGSVIKKTLSSSYPVGIQSLSVQSDFKAKIQSSRPVVIYVKDGGKINVNNCVQVDGSAQYFPSQKKITIQAVDDSSEFVILILSKSILQRMTSDFEFNYKQVTQYFSQDFKIPLKTWLFELLCRYEFERTVMGKSKNLACQFLELEIIKEIYCTYHEEKNPYHKYRFGVAKEVLKGKSSYVQKALQYIHSNIFESIDLEKLGKLSHCSKSTLIRHFKKDLKMSPSSYIRRQKLNMIDIILRTKDISVNEASDLMGYKCASDFICAYKKRFGHTPGTISAYSSRDEDL